MQKKKMNDLENKKKKAEKEQFSILFLFAEILLHFRMINSGILLSYFYFVR